MKNKKHQHTQQDQRDRQPLQQEHQQQKTKQEHGPTRSRRTEAFQEHEHPETRMTD